MGLTLLLLPGSAPGSAAAWPEPVRWREVDRLPVPVARGAVFRAAMTAVIAPGWRLYAMDEPENGPVPLDFQTRAESLAELVSVGADRPLREGGTGGDGDLLFYAGQARFVLRLRVRPSAAAGKGSVALHVRYQACNERMCLPPRTATLALPLTVSERGATGEQKP